MIKFLRIIYILISCILITDVSNLDQNNLNQKSFFISILIFGLGLICDYLGIIEQSKEKKDKWQKILGYIGTSYSLFIIIISSLFIIEQFNLIIVNNNLILKYKNTFLFNIEISLRLFLYTIFISLFLAVLETFNPLKRKYL